MRFHPKFLPLLAVPFLFSCGQSDTGTQRNPNAPGGFTQNETIETDGSNVKGIYAATLYPVNHNLQFKDVGLAVVQRDGDAFKATVKMKYSSKVTPIKQAIYTGRRCPELKDDLNKDAYIDINEALIAIGQITIPLDGNLDSQDAGREVYPAGDDVTGKYFYQVSASFERMFSDLKAEDQNPSDNIIKLSGQDGITFPGRVVLLQGLNEAIKLDPRVTGTPGESVNRSLPVACGILWKVEKMPEELEGEQI